MADVDLLERAQFDLSELEQVHESLVEVAFYTARHRWYTDYCDDFHRSDPYAYTDWRSILPTCAYYPRLLHFNNDSDSGRGWRHRGHLAFLLCLQVEILDSCQLRKMA